MLTSNVLARVWHVAAARKRYSLRGRKTHIKEKIHTYFLAITHGIWWNPFPLFYMSFEIHTIQAF